MFKKALALTLICATLAGCADNKELTVPTYNEVTETYVMETREIKTYGFLDQEGVRDPCVNYSLSMGNVIWSVLAAPGIVVPTYMVGFSLYEPEDVKASCLKNI